MVWERLRAIRKFKNLADYIQDEGGFTTTDRLGRRLDERFIDMESSLYDDENLLSTLIYSLNRFPPGFERFTRIKLIGHGDEISGCQRITSLARRYPAYVSPEGELLIFLRAKKHDLYDILSRLQSIICTSKEITMPLRNPRQRRRLRRVLSEDYETQMRTLSDIIGIPYIELIKTEKNMAKELRGMLSQTILTLAERSYGRFGLGSYKVRVDVTEKFREGSKSKSERLWAENIKKVIQGAGLKGRPLIIFSANLHSTRNLLSPYPRKLEPVAVEVMGPDGPLPTKYGHRQMIHIHPSTPRSQQLYKFYSKLEEHLEDEENQIRFEEANREFMIPIPDTNDPGTGVNCQLFDLGAIDWDMVDPYLHPNLDFIKNEQPILLVMDYPFGEVQAQNLITYLSFMARNQFVAFGAIGKAAGYCGNIGDVLIPNFFRKAGQKYTCDTQNIIEPDEGMFGFLGLTVERGTIPEGYGVGMSTLDGTFLGNQESYEYYLKQLQCPAGEMEGIGLAMGVQNMVLTGRIRNIPRAFVYYKSDVPTRKGEGLTGGSMGKELGIQSAYGCTLVVLNHLMNPATWTEVKYY